MQKIALIPITSAGGPTAQTLQQQLQAVPLCRDAVAAHWHDHDAFIFIGAMGICVRTIAPLIEDKHTDPAVICIDSTAQHVISVLSGHVGGANELAQHVASILGATPIITTQSDNTGLWALDTLAQRFHWTCAAAGDLNSYIIPFVNQEPTALLLDIRDEGTDYLERTLPSPVTLVKSINDITSDRFRLALIVSPYIYPTLTSPATASPSSPSTLAFGSFPAEIPTLQFIPPTLTLGIGLSHQASRVEGILADIRQHMEAHHLSPLAIRHYATIDVKADEPVVKHLQAERKEVLFFTAEQLNEQAVPTPSETVAKHVGTPSVSEAAALLASNHGKLLIPKQKGEAKDYTLAVAIDRHYLREAHIEIVGAGPGDPDLISVRGRRMLERADLILYAGSLVPKELTLCHKPGAVVRSSAPMSLEEQCALMKEHYDQGHFIVRLHTGDPCIFGAIQEQMAFFDRHKMSYHITPGISSFLAAAAELRSQFTIPERTQTIILTRGEGRTPMPEKEQLHLLARSQSTMCIFLSASLVDDVQAQLLQEYPEDTPVAACYHLTWPDQRIYRGKLKDLAKIVHDNHLTLTTMLVVGEAIDNRQGLSELYNKNFTHLFRKGE